MAIHFLKVDAFRNLKPQKIEFCKGLNFFYGDNAAGKTSVLEAISVLASGKSFRSSKTHDCLQSGKDVFHIFVTWNNNQTTHQSGLLWSKTHQERKLDSQKLSNLSTLVKRLPLMSFHPDTHLSITGEPDKRRSLMDWSLFHVEHNHHDSWKKYHQTLKQRNAHLKSAQKKELEIWDKQLIAYSEVLTSNRKNLINNLQKLILAYANDFGFIKHIELNYQCGWNKEFDYETCLTRQRQSDIDLGFTQSGPHRGDFVIRYNQAKAKTRLSRGQQKTLAYLLNLASTQVLQLNQYQTILLVDDLEAELDEKNSKIMIKHFESLGTQVFFTGVSIPSWYQTLDCEKKLFHVKQGAVKEML